MLGFIVNCGSNSIKTRLIETSTHETLFEANAEHLNTIFSSISVVIKDVSSILSFEDCHLLSHESAFELILTELMSSKIISDIEDIAFVGHRIVHGGTFFSKPTIITEDVIQKITYCCKLAPLHNPVGLVGIGCCEKLFPSSIHIAVFDTAFHQTISEINYRYAIPNTFYEEGIRKYGFHGTSYSYLTRVLGNNIGKNNISAIMTHIGQGTSVCAVKNGKSVYTSMEFSPLSGCIMETRSGNIDPTVIQFLCNKFNYTIDQILSILNTRSGLFSFTNTRNIIKILDGVKQKDEKCIFALDYFCTSIANSMSQAIIALGEKPKQIVFSGDIGENSDIVRDNILKKLTPVIGKHSYHTTTYSVSINDFFRDISSKSIVPIYVIQTNQELEIALEAEKLLS